MVIDLEVHTQDPEFVQSFVGDDPQNEPSSASGVTVRFVGRDGISGAWPGAPEILNFVIGVGTGVASKVIADLIYAKIKRTRGATVVRMNKRVVEITNEGLYRAVEEAFESRTE